MKKIFAALGLLASPALAQDAAPPTDHARTVCLQILNEANSRILDVTKSRQDLIAENERLKAEVARLNSQLPKAKKP